MYVNLHRSHVVAIFGPSMTLEVGSEIDIWGVILFSFNNGKIWIMTFGDLNIQLMQDHEQDVTMDFLYLFLTLTLLKGLLR